MFKKLLPGMEEEKDSVTFIFKVYGNAIVIDHSEIIVGDPAGSHVRISAVDGFEVRFGDRVLGAWEFDGDVFIGTDLSDPATTYLAVFAAAQSYNGEAVGAGDMLIGDNSSGEANFFFDKSAGRILIRGGVSAAAWIDTDGSITAGAGDVILDEDGVTIVLPVTFDPSGPDALKFVLPGGGLAAWVAGRGETGGDPTGRIQVGANFTSSAANATASAELLAGDGLDDLDYSAVRITAKHENSAAHLIELIVDDAVVVEVNEDAVEAKRNLVSEEHLTLKEQGSAPAAPLQDADANIYISNGNLVVQYDDGGTVRYKFLNLEGTGVEWEQDTSPP